MLPISSKNKDSLRRLACGYVPTFCSARTRMVRQPAAAVKPPPKASRPLRRQPEGRREGKRVGRFRGVEAVYREQSGASTKVASTTRNPVVRRTRFDPGMPPKFPSPCQEQVENQGPSRPTEESANAPSRRQSCSTARRPSPFPFLLSRLGDKKEATPACKEQTALRRDRCCYPMSHRAPDSLSPRGPARVPSFFVKNE